MVKTKEWRKTVMALAGHNTHSSVVLAFHNPPTPVPEGLGCWKVGGWRSQKTPVVIPALPTP